MSSPPSSTSNVKNEIVELPEVHRYEQNDLLQPIQNAAEEIEIVNCKKPMRRRKKKSSQLTYSARKNRELRKKETFFERYARLTKASLRAAAIRAMQTPEERMKKNAYLREKMRTWRRVQKQKCERNRLAMQSKMQDMNCLQEMDYKTRKTKTIELHERGHSVDTIAKKLQLSSKTVYSVLKQYQMEKAASESEVFIIDDDSNDDVKMIVPDTNKSTRSPIPASSPIMQLPTSIGSVNPPPPEIIIQTPPTIQNQAVVGNSPPIILNHQFYRRKTGNKRLDDPLEAAEAKRAAAAERKRQSRARIAAEKAAAELGLTLPPRSSKAQNNTLEAKRAAAARRQRESRARKAAQRPRVIITEDERLQAKRAAGAKRQREFRARLRAQEKGIEHRRLRIITRKREIEKPDVEAIVNKQGEQVGVYRRIRNVQIDGQNAEPINSSLQLGLKILAAAVPPEVHETLLGKGVIPAANTDVKSSNMIKTIPGKTRSTGSATPSPPALIQIGNKKTTLSVRNVSLTTIQNLINNNPGIKIASLKTNVPVLQQDTKTISTNTPQSVYQFQKTKSVSPPLPMYHLNDSKYYSELPMQQYTPVVQTMTPPLAIAPSMTSAQLSTIPKIAAVHSQFSPEVLKSAVKTSKLDQIIKEIESNPNVYLGVGKTELAILSFLANYFQVHKKEIYLIFRKMRQNESVEILADVFEMPLEEVVKIIIDLVPKMAMLFRKIMKMAPKMSKKTDCALARMKISIRKPNYMNDHPEEVSRYSTSADFYYLISCTHSGFINFVSRSFDGNSNYSNSEALFHFIKAVKAPAAYVIGAGFEKIDFDILRSQQINVKQNASICYKMNVVKALDSIKYFKIFAHSEMPMRYEFFKIIDDLVVVASTLHNIRLQ